MKEPTDYERAKIRNLFFTPELRSQLRAVEAVRKFNERR